MLLTKTILKIYGTGKIRAVRFGRSDKITEHKNLVFSLKQFKKTADLFICIKRYLQKSILLGEKN